MHTSAPTGIVRSRAAFGRRTAAVVVATIVAAATLSGCAPLDATVAADLQKSVQQVASYSSDSDTGSALTELDALQKKLDDAAAAGDVDDDRATAIQEGIDLVRADLDSIVAQAAAEAQAAADAAAAAEAAEVAKAAAAAEAAAATAAAEKAAADQAAAAKSAAEDAAKKAQEAENNRDNDNKDNKPGKEDDDD